MILDHNSCHHKGRCCTVMVSACCGPIALVGHIAIVILPVMTCNGPLIVAVTAVKAVNHCKAVILVPTDTVIQWPKRCAKAVI